MRAALIFMCFTLSSVASSLAYSLNFVDSFESGDMSATNPDGFRWGSNNRTSVVTAQAVVWSNGSKSVLIPSGRDWTPKDGLHSLRFRYPAGQAQAEQRFDMGTPQKDLWLKFWLRVPVNFSYGPSGSPNKFFSIFMDGYETAGDGSTVWWGMHRYNTTGSDLAVTYSNGNQSSSNGYQNSYVPFITTADQGRWMQMVLHVKTETTPGASNGLIQTWRRWSNEATFTQLNSVTGLPIKLPDSGSPAGFKTGYILGWANAAYTADTEWLLDSFTLSDTSLLIAPIAAPNPPLIQ